MTDLRVYSLIGAGGTGSFLFPALLRFLENYHGNQGQDFMLQVLDGDHFTPNNRERQLFEGRYVDENKANTVVAMHGTDKTVALPEYLGDDNIEKRIQDGDYVLIAADNFPVRSKIEKRGLELDNITVINGGNESYDGSCQIWMRRDGKNITPPLSHMHPEIHAPGDDRAEMDCMMAAQLPGGEQTIIANLASATIILNAVRLALEWERDHDNIPFHELFFDLNSGKMRPADWRKVEGWQ